jgi:hypothetical protein
VGLAVLGLLDRRWGDAHISFSGRFFALAALEREDMTKEGRVSEIGYDCENEVARPLMQVSIDQLMYEAAINSLGVEV